MRLTRLGLEGATLIEGDRHGDARGWFEETWSAAKLERAGLDQTFVQDNASYSADAATLRGLHCQTPPAAQGKLIAVLAGAIMDVIVDVRPASPTYGEHLCIDLDDRTPVRLFVPVGFLHGFITRAPGTLVHYKVTAPYSSDHDCSVAWDDPDLAIQWGVERPILSAKDARAPRLREAGPLFNEAAS